MRKIRDIFEIANYARQVSESNPIIYQELFCEMLMQELVKMKGKDIAPHLSCSFDVLPRKYKIELVIPVSFCESNPAEGNIE